MNVFFRKAASLFSIYADPLDRVVSRARNEFSIDLRNARSDLRVSFSARFPQEREDRETLRDALNAASRLHQSKHMALSYAVGDTTSRTAPVLFTERFQRAHFSEGSQENSRLLDDVDRLIGQFSSGMETSITGARILYGRFYEAVSSHTQASRLLKNYLNALKMLRGDRQDDINASEIQEALKQAFQGQFPNAEQALAGATYFLRSETKDVLTISSEGQTQHIQWLQNVRRALRSGNQDLVGRVIGEVTGALQPEAAQPARLKPVGALHPTI